jgi:hypothetical protein
MKDRILASLLAAVIVVGILAALFLVPAKTLVLGVICVGIAICVVSIYTIILAILTQYDEEEKQ